MSSLTLTNIQNQIKLYAYPILIVFGNIGNALIILRFWQQRQNACSLYLLYSAIMNSVYSTWTSFTRIFPIYYGDVTVFVFALCKISTYLQSVMGQAAKSMVVYACIDRFLITSDRVSFRALSTPKRAKYLIILTGIFWLSCSAFIPIMYTTVNGQCTTPPGVYSIFVTIFILIFIGLLPPVLSGIFGYLTYRNMRQTHARVHPITNNTTNANALIRRRDRELLVLVISEVFVYVVLASLYPIIRLEMMISGYALPNTSSLYSQIEVFILNIANLLVLINSVVPFYTYFIVSKPFRRKLKQLIISCYRKLSGRPTVPVAVARNEAFIQREARV